MRSRFNRRRFLGSSLAGVGAVPARGKTLAHAQEPRGFEPFVTQPDEPIFPLDGSAVEDFWRVRRKINPPVKSTRNPLIIKDREWEGYGPNIQGTVLYDPDDRLHKCWYQIFDNERYREHKPWNCYICYAESDDGYTWRKPELGLVERNGSKRNNIIKLGREFINVLAVQIAPPGSGSPRKFVGLYLDAPGVCLAFSDNGTEWTEHPGNPIEPSHSDDHNVILWDARGKKWMVYHRPRFYAGEWKRRRALIESRDLRTWTRQHVVFLPDEADPGEFMVMPVFQRGNLFFGLLALYDRTRGSNEVELVFSADGRAWSRIPPREHFLPMGPPGDFDGASIFLGSYPVIAGDEMRFYYGGLDGDHECLFPSYSTAVGVGTLPLDRMCGVVHSSRQGPGFILTRPMQLNGNAIEVNAGIPGRLRAAVLDWEAKPLPGFSFEDCRPFTGDSLRHRVSWKGGSIPSHAQPLRLKFELLDEATFYSFYVRSE